LQGSLAEFPNLGLCSQAINRPYLAEEMMTMRALQIGLGFLAGLAGGWGLTQQGWVQWQLSRRRPAETLRQHRNEAPPGLRFEQVAETAHFTKIHRIEDGLERVYFKPKNRRFETVLFFQHGMWHGAWCWAEWQALFAEWGWESVAFSLPGHGGSPEQRRIERCTLDYYLGFIKDELAGFANPVVMVGHSMGGALTQWALKFGLPMTAAVFVAPWPHTHTVWYGAPRMIAANPWMILWTSLRWQAVYATTPEQWAKLLISPGASYTPQQLAARLGPESALVTYQHNWPHWSPPLASELTLPRLWLAAENDATIAEAVSRRSAAHYGADYVMVPGVGHNLMMEHNAAETAQTVQTWLLQQALP
jgi:pimeloyl-ACP methyl ester carboxylesterase